MADQLTILTQQVANLTTAYNQLITQARSIPELPPQTPLYTGSLLQAYNGSISQKITVQQIIDAALSVRQNQLLSIGTITVAGNDLTIPAGATWLINNVNYSNPSNIVINVPYAEDGNTRTDIIVADELNNMYRVNGPETGGISPAPNVPLNTVLVTTVNVTDDSINETPAVPGVEYNTDDIENVSTVLGATASDAFGNVITSYAKSSKGLLIGDSTIAAYAGGSGIETFLLEPADVFQGSTILNQAVPGNTINQQLTIYNADANKATYDWIIVQIGLNDILPTSETAATVIARYQNLVNTIYSTKKSTAKIIVSAMLPCKQRFIDLVGAVDGALAQQKWVDINNAIMGGGATPVINVDFRNNDHVLPLSDGNGNIAKNYNVASGDNIHENNNGRMIIASAMRKTLTLAGFFRPKSQNIFSKYFTNTGNNVYLKDGILNIDSKIGAGTAALFIRNNVNGVDQYTQSTYAITKTDLSETQYFSLGVGNYGNGTAREENFYLFYNNPTTAVSYDLWRTDKNGNLTNKGAFTNGGNIFAPDVEITSATSNFSTALNLKNNTNHANARTGMTLTNQAGEATVLYRANSGGSTLYSTAGDFTIAMTTNQTKFFAGGNVSFGFPTDNGNKVSVNGKITATAGTAASDVVVKSQLDLKADATALPTSGGYTPTLTGVSNTTSISHSSKSAYTKVGNIVTFKVAFSIVPTVINTVTSFDITLPIARANTGTDTIGSGSIPNTGANYSSCLAQSTTTTTVRVYFYALGTASSQGVINCEYDITQ